MILKYGFVGVANTLISYLNYFVISLFWPFSEIGLVILVNGIQTITGYVSYGTIVFTKRLHFVGYFKFLLSAGMSNVASILSFLVFFELFNFQGFTSFVLSSFLSASILFTLSRSFAFKQKTAP